jgi:drug/metabolite transporter (DMT)-like permease
MPLPTAAATRKGILLMLLAIVFFTTMDAAAKGLIARYPAPQVVWARFAGQALIVLVILRPRRAILALQSQHPWLHMVRSACQLGATTLFFSSLAYIGLAEATALTDTNPVLITLGAALFLGEKLGIRRILGVIAAMIGALIIIRPGLSVFTPAALLPLGAAICYTGNALLTRHLGPKEGAATALLHAALFGCALTTLALPFVWHPIATADIPLFLLLGVLGTGAQLCIIRSFSMAEASVVAPFAYLGIVFATLWGMVLYGEFPDRWTLIGALVIVMAGLYVWHRETRARRPSGQTPVDPAQDHA